MSVSGAPPPFAPEEENGRVWGLKMTKKKKGQIGSSKPRTIQYKDVESNDRVLNTPHMVLDS